MGIFDKFKHGLKKTRDNISSMVGDVLTSFKRIDEDFYEQLEETLILCDTGAQAAADIIEELRTRVREEKITETSRVKELLASIIADMLRMDAEELEFPCVILVVGVNGVGKTTAIGKLANLLVSSGKSVVLAAADTFRRRQLSSFRHGETAQAQKS